MAGTSQCDGSAIAPNIDHRPPKAVPIMAGRGKRRLAGIEFMRLTNCYLRLRTT